jgi:hypothetical protein
MPFYSSDDVAQKAPVARHDLVLHWTAPLSDFDV